MCCVLRALLVACDACDFHHDATRSEKQAKVASEQAQATRRYKKYEQISKVA